MTFSSTVVLSILRVLPGSMELSSLMRILNWSRLFFSDLLREALQKRGQWTQVHKMESSIISFLQYIINKNVFFYIKIQRLKSGIRPTFQNVILSPPPTLISSVRNYERKYHTGKRDLS